MNKTKLMDYKTLYTELKAIREAAYRHYGEYKLADQQIKLILKRLAAGD